jgi:hypothetical protein
MPVRLESGFDEGKEEPDDLEELNLDEHPLSGLDGFEPPAPVLRPQAPPSAPRAGAPPLRALDSRPATSYAAAAVRPAAPATITVDVEPGQQEVMVPVEIALEPGRGPVTLNLKIILRPRR